MGLRRSHRRTTPSSPCEVNCWPWNGLAAMPYTARVDQVVTVDGGERRSYTRSHLLAIAAARRGVWDADEPGDEGDERKAADVTTSDEPNETSGVGSVDDDDEEGPDAGELPRPRPDCEASRWREKARWPLPGAGLRCEGKVEVDDESSERETS